MATSKWDTYNEKQGGWEVHAVLMVRSFFLKSSCQGTETDLNGATTFHAAAIRTALHLVWVKIPMEIQMCTGVKNPGQRETQRVVNPA